MIKLHGFSLSNYYNIVKHGLLEKGVQFEEVPARPNQESDYLAISPMGKIPCLQTDEGHLTESSVILDYIEEVYPEPALSPKNPFQRAKTRELMHMAELYVELPARRHIKEVIFGGDRDQAAFIEVKPAMERGLSAIAQLTSFKPYVSGSEFGYADIYLFHVFGLASEVIQGVYDWNIVADVPGLGQHLDAVGTRESSQKVVSDRQAARQEVFGN